jgi:hypothetical protein
MSNYLDFAFNRAETPPPQTITVTIPDLPETRRFKSHHLVPILREFLVWFINNDYQVRAYDTALGQWDTVDLEDPDKVTETIQAYLKIDPGDLARERNLVYQVINEAMEKALGA